MTLLFTRAEWDAFVVARNIDAAAPDYGVRIVIDGVAYGVRSILDRGDKVELRLDVQH